MSTDRITDLKKKIPKRNDEAHLGEQMTLQQAVVLRARGCRRAGAQPLGQAEPTCAVSCH